MAADSTRPIEGDDRVEGLDRLHLVFSAQKRAFDRDRFPSEAARAARLDALIAALDAHEDRLIAAVNADFGNRAAVETRVADVILSIGAAKHAKRHLGRWMRRRGVATPLPMLPATSRVEPQPLGVVGVIAPWNYPVQLALSPAVAAIAAGNRVMIKPSELTPRTSEALAAMIGETFDEDLVAVVTGGVDVGQAFTELRFDHLLFTGSTAIGRRVAMAAAKNLTPVTLELGGKSPAIVDAGADLAKAGYSIARGKLFNAGQTCIAPDYVLAPAGKTDAVVDAIVTAARKLHPDIDRTDDYTSIVSDRHFERLKRLVEEARAAGAKVVEVGEREQLHRQRKLPLTIVVDPPAGTALMDEEIFGPVLPVLTVASREAAISFINAGERPLALYWFGEDKAACEDVLKRTVSGGVTVNDTLWHCAQERLPFGGVGESGVGAYHGDAGFETFSHLKPVFRQSRFSTGAQMDPPYTDKTNRLIGLFRKII
ncbi:MAG: aldehyde dehydrogenase family protein [Alphaproteobacteria bacterium]|nr:aldehyde dehydrogenase family protein [Alphaproteobacteria bacterium]